MGNNMACAAEKQPTGHGPEGCDENGPAAALLVGYVSIQISALLAPCRRPILIATKAMLFMGQDTIRSGSIFDYQTGAHPFCDGRFLPKNRTKLQEKQHDFIVCGSQ